MPRLEQKKPSYLSHAAFALHVQILKDHGEYLGEEVADGAASVWLNNLCVLDHRSFLCGNMRQAIVPVSSLERLL